MLITRTSPFTGKVHTLDIDITSEQLERYEKGNELIQHVFPKLTPNEREFIKTGITHDEWESVFGKED